MASQLDKSLDEITAERRQTGPKPRRGNAPRHEPRRSVGGVQKRRADSYASPARRGGGSSNENWTHDLFDRNGDKGDRLAGNPLAARLGETRNARLKVENLHYDLTEEDLSSLFGGIGPVESLRLKYDKAGRSDGVAYVTYTSLSDANEAIRKFNGANAAGQPITVALDAEITPRRQPIGPRPGAGRGFRRGGPRPIGGRMASGGGRGGPRGPGGEGRERQPRRTQEDLDKELDAFMSGPPPAENSNNDGAAEAAGNGEEMALD